MLTPHLPLNWFYFDDHSYTFETIFKLSTHLAAPESIGYSTVFCESSIINTHIHWFMAAFLRGYSLAPVSDLFSEKAKLKQLTNAIDLLELVKTRNTNQSHSFEFQLPETIAFIQTSGSSGHPKTVRISKKMVEAATTTTFQWIQPETKDTWLLTLPIHHVGGLSILIRALWKPYQIRYKPHLGTNELLEILTNENIHYVSLVPTQLKRLLDAGFSKPKFLKKILLGGGPASVDLLQKAVDSGLTIINSYGMTETAAQFTGIEFQPGTKISASSVGNCVGTNQFKLEKETEIADEGLLWISGPQVLENYPFENQNESFQNGWFCTGDYARLNENNELEIVIRRTDRIVTGGENVNPNEVEQVLTNFPNISDVGVCGIDDAEWGQKVVAFYSGQPTDAEKLKHFLKQKMDAFKIPKEFIFVESIPRLSLSKINRKKLNALYFQLKNTDS